MFIVSVALVVCSGLMNATWNFLAKKSKHKNVFLGSIYIFVSLLLTPVLVIELAAAKLPVEAYALITASLLLQSMYGYLLSKVYSVGDLSLTYPIMRGTSTFVIPIIGVLFLGEVLSLLGWAGIAVIVSGMFLLSGFHPKRLSKLSAKPILLSLLVGACITTYTLVDKTALHYISALSLLQVSNIGFMLSMLPSLFKREQILEEWKLNWRIILIGSVMSPGSYLLYLLAMKLAPIAQLAPIREVGTVFATLLGVFVLKEAQSRARIVGAVIIALGIIAVGFGGK